MDEEVQLNVPLLKRRVPNLTTAAQAVGLRAATVSNLCTGKIPIGRAEVKTLVALASLARCTLDELIIRGSGMRMMETGIKVLDLFSPIVRGGTVGFVARPNMGQLVLLAELMHRMNKRGFVTLFWYTGAQVPGVNHIQAQATSCHSTLEEVYSTITNLRDEKDILLAIDRTTVLTGELFTLRKQLKEAGARPITIALVDVDCQVADDPNAYGPLDTLWRFDTDLMSRSIYPAIDPIASTSTILEGAHLDAVHLAAQQRARKLLRRYRELRQLVAARGFNVITDSDAQLYNRGERLEAYFAQPFYVSAPYTNKPGEWVSLYETLGDVKRIMDGEADKLEPAELLFKGKLVAAE